MARALDLAVTPWSVLAAGVLSGKYNRADAPAQGRAREGAAKVERNRRIADVVIEVAAEIGCSPSQVAIRWAMQQPGVVIPLLGARSVEQLRDNLGAVEIRLEPEQLRRLEAASAIELGFPHDFLAQDAIRELIYGGTLDQLDAHRGPLNRPRA
jgi:aryl-alcohol dehydrogenase-like predicted oxidoreductase